MTPPNQASASLPSNPLAEAGRSDALEAIRAVRDACIPLASTVPGDRATKVATLAVAEAVLADYDLPPISQNPAPRRAISYATQAVAGLTPEIPQRAGEILATLFEGAAGERGRRNEGVVYTPKDVVEFMVREALAARIHSALGLDEELARAAAAGEVSGLNPVEAQALAALLGTLRVVDPAVGGGAFLVGVSMGISRLARALRNAGSDEVKELAASRHALETCCHGFEVDPDATLLASAVLALACHEGVPARLPSVVTTRNAVIGGLQHSSAPNGWDMVLMNPPYVGAKQVRARLGREVQEQLKKQDGFAGDLLGHFVLRALGGLRRGGVLGAIVSDTTFTMSSAAPVREVLFERSGVFSLAWCRPFSSVAPNGGVVVTIRDHPGSERISCYEAGAGRSLVAARPRIARRSDFVAIPGKPMHRPSRAASAILRRWTKVQGLEVLWSAVSNRSESAMDRVPACESGEWTLLGTAVAAGQGLATGDDRRFVGFLEGTAEADLARGRQRAILERLRSDTQYRSAWRVVKHELGLGRPVDETLLAVLQSASSGQDLPGRKPFRVIGSQDVRVGPLSESERRHGISDGRCWIPYETSDRSSNGGRRWSRHVPTLLDWSREAVAELRARRERGPRKPVMRHEEMWFKGGVTHNRVTSHLRARLLSRDSIFSSESPCYVPCVPWLDTPALLALLNAPVVEFALKTFLSTRNHIELGQVKRLPVPVLSEPQRRSLSDLGTAAVAASETAASRLGDLETELDALTRDIYGIPRTLPFPISR